MAAATSFSPSIATINSSVRNEKSSLKTRSFVVNATSSKSLSAEGLKLTSSLSSSLTSSFVGSEKLPSVQNLSFSAGRNEPFLKVFAAANSKKLEGRKLKVAGTFVNPSNCHCVLL